MSLVIKKNDCDNCCKQDVCRFFVEYIENCKTIEKSVICDVVNVEIKCSAFSEKQTMIRGVLGNA